MLKQKETIISFIIVIIVKQYSLCNMIFFMSCNTKKNYNENVFKTFDKLCWIGTNSYNSQKQNREKHDMSDRIYTICGCSLMQGGSICLHLSGIKGIFAVKTFV